MTAHESAAARRPPPAGLGVPAATAVDRLDQAECWRLLGWAHIGRLATSAGDRVEIFPVNYLVRDDAILFRSAAGTKLAELMERPEVAFEIDGEDSRWHWSVVVHGKAELLEGDAEIMRSGSSNSCRGAPPTSSTSCASRPTPSPGAESTVTSSAAAA